MKSEYTFRHIDHSDALVQYAEERLEKLERYELKPMDVHFVLAKEGDTCHVHALLNEGRRKFKAEAESEDFYRALDMVLSRLQRQLSKRKTSWRKAA